jgi:hypothetical protein
MTPSNHSLTTDPVSFLNRDHIVSATIHDGEIVVTTTAGTKISVPASAPVLARFADELANSVQSNFVSIASSIPTSSTPIS